MRKKSVQSGEGKKETTMPRTLEAVETVKSLINGQPVTGQGQLIELRHHFTQEMIAQGHELSPEQVDQAVSAARAAQQVMAEMPRHKRAALLRETAARIEQRSEEIARMITLECGKPIKLSRSEVGRSVELFGFAADEAKRFTGEMVPIDASSRGEGRMAFTRREPIGVVGAITPFNFPLNLVSHKVAPALAVGNTIVHKPTINTPRTALLLAQAITEAGAPPGAINVLLGSVSVGEAMVTHPGIDMISFTGSPTVGWRIKERSGRKRTLLELGSNSATIIDADADLDRAIPRCVSGAFDYSGQICISVQRIFIHQAIAQQFTERFLAAVGKLRLGDPLEEDTDLGPMINLEAAERIESWVKEAVAGGAQMLTGGRREGAMYEPTVLTKVSPEMKVSCLEAFAPIVTLTTFSTLDEAIELVNDSIYGLQAGIYTNDLAHAFEAAKRIKVGGVIINDIPNWRVDQMPYGGIKESGVGREGVRYTMEEMTDIKLVVFNL